MKIVITAAGEGPDAPVDERFGRAPFFTVHDTESASYDTVARADAADAAQGAGVLAAETVSKLGGNVVITGHCGPKAYRALSAAGIAVVVGATGTIRDAVAAYLAGDLSPASAPDVEGHWV